MKDTEINELEVRFDEWIKEQTALFGGKWNSSYEDGCEAGFINGVAEAKEMVIDYLSKTPSEEGKE